MAHVLPLGLAGQGGREVGGGFFKGAAAQRAEGVGSTPGCAPGGGFIPLSLRLGALRGGCLCPQRSGSKHASTPADNYYLARRRTLQVVVSSLLTEAGFESAEKAAVETLTEMLQSCECLARSHWTPEVHRIAE